MAQSANPLNRPPTFWDNPSPRPTRQSTGQISAAAGALVLLVLFGGSALMAPEPMRQPDNWHGNVASLN